MTPDAEEVRNPEAEIPYVSVDLGSAACQENNMGGDICAVLRKLTGVPTIPQIFVASQQIGGATETFDAFNDGSLKRIMLENGIRHNEEMNIDAFSFLPKWLHPR